MRRCHIILLLLFVLPFQMAWAAVAPVCGHETQVAAKKHFGHHEHEHEGGAAYRAAADGGESGAEGPGLYHADCESCHLGAGATLIAPTLAFAALPHGPARGAEDGAFRSHVPNAPERPDRIELAAAARFGGGVEFRPLPS